VLFALIQQSDYKIPFLENHFVNAYKHIQDKMLEITKAPPMKKNGDGDHNTIIHCKGTVVHRFTVGNLMFFDLILKNITKIIYRTKNSNNYIMLWYHKILHFLVV